MRAKYILYLIHNKTTNTYYIGQTNNWRRRAVEHGLSIPSYRRNSKRYYKKPEAFYNGNHFIKESLDAGDEIEYTWIQICDTKSAVNLAEVYWIQSFKDLGLTLYNRTCGGLYDEHIDVKSVDISHYPKQIPLDLNAVSRILQDKNIMREDNTYRGLEKQIHDALVSQAKFN